MRSKNADVGILDGMDGCYVTDGPFFYRADGRLKMLWSGHGLGRYPVPEAESDSLHGKWRHSGSKFELDGGHPMLFERLDGTRTIALHSPNRTGLELALFLEFP